VSCGVEILLVVERRCLPGGGLETKRHYVCSQQSGVTEWMGRLPWLRLLSVCVERERVARCIYSWVYVV
jgi:hypothetical protein